MESLESETVDGGQSEIKKTIDENKETKNEGEIKVNGEVNGSFEDSDGSVSDDGSEVIGKEQKNDDLSESEKVNNDSVPDICSANSNHSSENGKSSEVLDNSEELSEKLSDDEEDKLLNEDSDDKISEKGGGKDDEIESDKDTNGDEISKEEEDKLLADDTDDTHKTDASVGVESSGDSAEKTSDVKTNESSSESVDKNSGGSDHKVVKGDDVTNAPSTKDTKNETQKVPDQSEDKKKVPVIEVDDEDEEIADSGGGDEKSKGGGDEKEDEDKMEEGGTDDKEGKEESGDKADAKSETESKEDEADKAKEEGGSDVSLSDSKSESVDGERAAKLEVRRSTRVRINKQKEKEKEKEREREKEREKNQPTPIKRPRKSTKEEEPEIQEIIPQDPLGDPLADPLADPLDEVRDPFENDKENKAQKKTTIIIDDTKSLVDIAAGMKGNKKEPTLVIIDTNSILSGRGPVAVAQHPVQQQPTPTVSTPSTSSLPFTVMPVALPAQGMYPPLHPATAAVQPVQTTVTTITPVAPTTTVSRTVYSAPAASSSLSTPTLTDDMYVVEAPSFIVPYVYEKPPKEALKEIIRKIDDQIKKQEEEEKQKKEAEAKAKAEEKIKAEEKVKAEEKAKADEKEKAKAEEKAKRDEKDGKDTDGMDKESTGEKMEVDKDKDDKESSKEDDSKKTELDKDKEKPDEDKGKEKKDEKEVKAGSSESSSSKEVDKIEEKTPKSGSYFDSPLGRFFMSIGLSLVQEYVQTDLLRSQKRRRDKEGGRGSAKTQAAIHGLLKNLERSKEHNEPFHFEQKKCEYCSFKTESSIVMAHHLETPHMKNYVYKCNYCTYDARAPQDILYHMEAEHNVRARLDRGPCFHQCPQCPFEDNSKAKLTRHTFSCNKKFRPDRNLEPSSDWEPPAKIPRMTRGRPPSLGPGFATLKPGSGMPHPLMPKLIPAPGLSHLTHASLSPGSRPRGRPPGSTSKMMPELKAPLPRAIAPTQLRQGFGPTQGMIYRPSTPNSQPLLVPTSYQIGGNQIYQVRPVMGGQHSVMPMVAGGLSSATSRLTLLPPSASNTGPTPVALVPNLASGSNSITIQSATSNKLTTNKLPQQPSISITPLPRQPSSASGSSQQQFHKPGQNGSGGKASFVICEICDGYIKDLEQLRNHMQWIHKVKIHPKMIYNRPPLNCQKCQFRFFTDQGLERHLLGSHGLVTSSMQEAANKGKDGGRCPVCGRVYQWKLLNHVARDHNMTLKPAHLSYKCTVCTATFGMYKQFENHVYSAHSVVAKRVMDKKPGNQQNSSSSAVHPNAQAQGLRSTAPQSAQSLLKPLKINDEITIIPQPPTRTVPSTRPTHPLDPKNNRKIECEECDQEFEGNNCFSRYIIHYRRRHLKKCHIKLCRLDGCPTCKKRHVTEEMVEYLNKLKEERGSRVDIIELSDDEMVVASESRGDLTVTKICPPGPKCFKQKFRQKNLKSEAQKNVQVIELDDSPVKKVSKPASEDIEDPLANGDPLENGEDALSAVKERLRRRRSLEISQVDVESEPPPAKKTKMDT